MKIIPLNAHESEQARSKATGDALILRRVSDVQSEAIRWLWYPRIALGKLTLIAGDPGLGKSQLTAYLAAIVTTGRRWPNDDGCSPKGGVLMLSCEDDIADTIRPRLEAAGADLEAVQVIEAVRTGEGRARGFSLVADLDHLERVLKADRSIRLVTVDPITAYLGGTDTHRTSDVRAALSPLQTLASEYGVAVVAVSHLNKATGGGKSINAVTGSGAFVAAARASFLVVKDDEDEARRLLIESKNNLGKAPALAFRISQADIANGIIAPYVVFEAGTVDVTADEALVAASATSEGSAIDEAVAFLKEELADGDVAATRIKSRASAMSITERTLRRAADKIGAKRIRVGFGKDGVWNWRLLQDGADESKVANNAIGVHSENVDINGLAWPPMGRTSPSDVPATDLSDAGEIAL